MPIAPIRAPSEALTVVTNVWVKDLQHPAEHGWSLITSCAVRFTSCSHDTAHRRAPHGEALPRSLPMARAGWFQLIPGESSFRGADAVRIPAYSEFMPPPRVGWKPYGQ